MTHLTKSSGCSAWSYEDDDDEQSSSEGSTFLDLDQGTCVGAHLVNSTSSNDASLLCTSTLSSTLPRSSTDGSPTLLLPETASEQSNRESRPLLLLANWASIVCVGAVLVATAVHQLVVLGSQPNGENWGIPIAERGGGIIGRERQNPSPSVTTIAIMDPSLPLTLVEAFGGAIWDGGRSSTIGAASLPAKDAAVEVVASALDDATVSWLESLRLPFDAVPDGAYLSAEERFNASFRAPVRIAVVGQAGTGKSTLVNTMRGLAPAAKGAAPTSPTQMTGVRAPYEASGYSAPGHPGVVYHDLPGCGTPAAGACGPEYVVRFGLDRFDAFVLATQRRVVLSAAGLQQRCLA